MNGKRKISQFLSLRIALIGLCTVAIMLGLTTGSALAQEDPPDEKPAAAETAQPATPAAATTHPGGAASLGEAATNPIAPLMQLQLQNTYNWKNHNSDSYSNTSVIQTVIPVKLPWDKVPGAITRLTLPYVTTPDFDDPLDRQRGFGDTNFLFLATPKLKAKKQQIGVGFSATFPTAGDNDFTGSGKWQAGPAFLYINMKTPKLQWGFFGYQQWDFASTSSGSDRSGVSKTYLQPFITKHFGKGWFVGSPETPQVYDSNSDKWTWALGPQLGKVFKIGKQPVKAFGAIYYNPENNNGPTPEWTGKVGISFLFPE